MRRTLSLSVALCLVLFSTGAGRDRSPDVAPSAPPAHVTDLAEYVFDDPFGGPDLQGWTTVDRTVRPDTFTHVDDFAGLDSRFFPNEGTKSLWMGTRPSPELCSYENLPGYGNSWHENFESVPFSTAGDVTISYSIRYDTEVGYDFVYVDYRSKTGSWRNLATYNGPLQGGAGIGPIVESYTVPAESLDSSARFRFKFTSDGAVSDQGGYFAMDSSGPAVIDSITVTDAAGVVDYQDFESETIGARATSDGDWQAGVRDIFGDFAELVSGINVLQEDSVVVNTSYLWSFLNGSPDTYACGGHPGQASVPILPVGGYVDQPVYIHNGAASPIIDLTKDKDGFPVPGPPDQLSVEYDVYVDSIPDNWVRHGIAVKVFRDGCFDSFWSYLGSGTASSGGNKAWRHGQVSTFLPSDASHVQVMVYALDTGTDGTHTCHSHAPLFDNVKVQGYFDTASEVGDTPVAGYALHANVPNPFNPVTSVAFDVPAPGGEVRVAVFDVSGRWIATLADGRHTGGTHTVEWNGRDATGTSVASGVYFYRLLAPGVDLSHKMVLLK